MIQRNYRQDFRDYSDQSTWTIWKVTGIIFMGFIALTVLSLGACAVGLFSGAATNGAQVIQKEFYPDALLKKYEWFKDTSAALDKKQADMKVYDTRIKSLTDAYEGVARSKWPRDDREQMSIWQSEAAGIRASYNQLAAEYNAQMVKFNWRFTNTGDLPPGAVTPLPREFKTYETQ